MIEQGVYGVVLVACVTIFGAGYFLGRDQGVKSCPPPVVCPKPEKCKEPEVYDRVKLDVPLMRSRETYEKICRAQGGSILNKFQTVPEEINWASCYSGGSGILVWAIRIGDSNDQDR